MAAEPAFTYGIEEEYLLIDPQTLNLAPRPPSALFKEAVAAAEALPGAVTRELLRAQLEVGTGVCTTTADGSHQLKQLRRVAINSAENHGLGLIACSTHPFAYSSDQHQTNRRRYREIAEELQFVARRLMVCGMHVHIGIDDPETRIGVLNALREYLPLLLALSASSPFWEGEDTGLKSVRPVILDELPRSGPPDRFLNYAGYSRALKSLTQTGVIEDASKIWWDARLSAKWPTIEIRIMDVAPRVLDALALAALCRCLCRMLWRQIRDAKPAEFAPRLVVMENRWRAQRFGAFATLIDYRETLLVPIADQVRRLLEQLRPDADHFGCRAELDRLTDIARNGSSAGRQRKVFNAKLDSGAGVEEALKAVVTALREETRQDIGI